VRPLYQEKAEGLTCGMSPANTLLDHTPRDGVDNFVTITGGKWTTYRLMAEETVTWSAKNLASDCPCQTATTVLKSPGERKFYTLGQRLESWKQASGPPAYLRM
jgi:glycerol-3-phosphate dehydrogenase